MASLFYSMSGEGRGHATRVRAIVDVLRARHKISIFAPGDAYDLLQPAYKDSDVPVTSIPGLRFHYTAKHRLDPPRTIAAAGSYLWGFRRLIGEHVARMKEQRPDLILTDFEPSLPRAAKRCGIPFISINHQHFLIVNDLGMLPIHLQRHAYMMSLVVRSYYQGMARTVVSSFYFPPLKKGFEQVVQTGVILRPSVLATVPSRAGHLVAYLRRFAPDNVMEALRGLKMRVKVYGLGKRPDEEHLRYEEINEERFLADLGSAEALISTAGNQLVGEALYLGKPVFAMPETNNHEQFINAFFLAYEGTGDWEEIERVNTATLDRFLARVDEFRGRIQPERYNGTPAAVNAVEQFLERKKTS
jgi:uncharacterized protein (TIGR00661 family)